jgi:U3 small nucleolar RNA-associated protein 18
VEPTVQPSTRKKTAVWSDAADTRVTVSLATDKRLRKLRDAPTEDEVTGKVYETKLRRQ